MQIEKVCLRRWPLNSDLEDKRDLIIYKSINFHTHNEYKFGKKWDIVTEKKNVERHSGGGRR